MNILILNAGSSSLKLALFNDKKPLLNAEFEDFRDDSCKLCYRVNGLHTNVQQRSESLKGLREAFSVIPALLDEFELNSIDAIGHRVVHGGSEFTESVIINDEVLKGIEACSTLAPLHNPINLRGIHHSLELWPSSPQIAVFDTAFHHSLPAVAYTYAIPQTWRDAGIRRFGFHGLSHQDAALRATSILQRPINDLRIISCHLGNGASVCAINSGQSFDTSMGMTPLEGLVMGSRSGDIDPGIFGYLARTQGLTVVEIEHQLNHDSGLKALAGSHDLRDIELQAQTGDNNAKLAIALYAYRVRKTIGAYTAAMEGVDAIVFTGGIGENSATMRQAITEPLKFLGAELNNSKNQSLQLNDDQGSIISNEQSTVSIVVSKACEQRVIAKEVTRLLSSQ